MSCDTQVCADLVRNGFPSSNLLPLGPGSNDPLGSDLVVATATVRNQFGSRLAVYAPAVIASFGTGNARIDIRWVYPDGAKAYRAALPAALRARKAADAQLLTNSNIWLSATAKEQLRSGQIDPWLPLLLALMAHSHPLRIVDFASQSPGGGPASLMRWVDVATTVKAAHLTRAAYLGWMRSFIDTQRAEYQPVWVQQVTLPNGQAVLRIGYGAPSPLSYRDPALVLADGRAGTAVSALGSGPPCQEAACSLPGSASRRPPAPPQHGARRGNQEHGQPVVRSRGTIRRRCLSGCVAGTPLRSPPRLREDVTGPQRAGLAHRLGSSVLPIETPGLDHRSDSAGSHKLADPGTSRKK